MNSGIWWKKKRVKMGFRKVELARMAGLSPTTIIRLESGDTSITEETKSKVRNILDRKTAVET
jgi:predicted transcriptional regulator